jgi:hypothetical protein
MTFEEYLSKHELNPVTKKERKDIYKVYRAIYMKEFKQKQKDTHVRIERVIPKEFHQRLKNKAKELGIPFRQFINEGFEAILNQTFILRRRESLSKIEFLLSNTSNNVNQLAFYNNRTKGNIKQSEFKQLQNEILSIRKGIRKAYEYPSTVRQFLESQIKRNPNFLTELEIVIQKLKNDINANKNNLT